MLVTFSFIAQVAPKPINQKRQLVPIIEPIIDTIINIV